jgi:hypothetical protein
MAEHIPERITGKGLLARARALYDDSSLPFAEKASSHGWRRGFVSGAQWMGQIMSFVGKRPLSSTLISYQALGLFKYGLATSLALIFLLVMAALNAWPLIVGAVLVFYAVEVQMVFLFPLALDGHAHLLRESRRWTVRAGGTLHVMAIVMQLAFVMLFGGLAGQGFVRSWALGCMAVVLWYEELRAHPEGRSAPSPTKTRHEPAGNADPSRLPPSDNTSQ